MTAGAAIGGCLTAILLIALLCAGYGATQAFRIPYGPWHIATVAAAMVAVGAGVVLLRQRRPARAASRLRSAVYGAVLLILVAAAGEPKELYVISGAGHSDLMQAEPHEYERRVAAFLDKYLPAPAVAPNAAPR